MRRRLIKSMMRTAKDTETGNERKGEEGTAPPSGKEFSVKQEGVLSPTRRLRPGRSLSPTNKETKSRKKSESRW
jgi:hypothetical protein